MASRTLSAGARSAFAAYSSMRPARNFHATARTLADATATLPARKPVGAFRGGLFGFLLGTTLAGAGVYGYTLREYKASNELLTEDIYALQAACQKLNTYCQALEDKMDAAERKRK
ncbi:Uu.00g044110.m01.CDS01 [Anthostomella pinea]|uniref:Uu.00g044110.m01.CDS01 n=1 Tax=Anthostomella pinea TaxID=933095 RepID=A0AAI8YEE8_9PEZI|nr:Uu.00g044110.m01.CDS01 [Anthostomella pinea]